MATRKQKKKTSQAESTRGAGQDAQSAKAIYEGAGKNFKIKYIGSKEISDYRNSQLVSDAMTEFRKFSGKQTKASVNISFSGITITNEKTKIAIVKAPIQKLKFVCHDKQDSSHFAAILQFPSESGQQFRIVGLQAEKPVAIMFVRSTNEIFKMLYEKMQQERRSGGGSGTSRQASAGGARQTSSASGGGASAGPERSQRPTSMSSEEGEDVPVTLGFGIPEPPPSYKAAMSKKNASVYKATNNAPVQAPSLAPPPQKSTPAQRPTQQQSETTELYTPVVKQTQKQKKQQQQQQTNETSYTYVEQQHTQQQSPQEALYSNASKPSAEQQRQRPQPPRGRQNTMPVLERPPQALPRTGRATTQRKRPNQPQPPPPYSSLNAGQQERLYDEVPSEDTQIPSTKSDEGVKRKQKALPPPPSSQEEAELEEYVDMNVGRAESSGIYSLVGAEEGVIDFEGQNATSPDAVWEISAGFEDNGALHSPPPTEPPPPLPENIYDVPSNLPAPATTLSDDAKKEAVWNEWKALENDLDGMAQELGIGNMRSSHMFSETTTIVADTVASSVSNIAVQPTEAQTPISPSTAFGEVDPFDSSLFGASFPSPTDNTAKETDDTVNADNAFGNFNSEGFSFGDNAFPISPAGESFDITNFGDPFAVAETKTVTGQSSNTTNEITFSEFSFDTDWSMPANSMAPLATSTKSNTDPFKGDQWPEPSTTSDSATTPAGTGNFFDAFESNQVAPQSSDLGPQPASNMSDGFPPQLNNTGNTSSDPSLSNILTGTGSPFDLQTGNESSSNQGPTDNQAVSKSVGESDFTWVGAEMPESSINEASKLASPPPGPSNTSNFNPGWGSSGLMAHTMLVSSGTGPVLSTSSASDAPSPEFDSGLFGSPSEGNPSDVNNSVNNTSLFDVNQGDSSSNDANIFGSEWAAIATSNTSASPDPPIISSAVNSELIGASNWPEENTAPESNSNTFTGFGDDWEASPNTGAFSVSSTVSTTTSQCLSLTVEPKQDGGSFESETQFSGFSIGSTKPSQPFLPPPQSKHGKNRRTTKTTAATAISLVTAPAEFSSIASKTFDAESIKKDGNSKESFNNLGLSTTLPTTEGNQICKMKQEFPPVAHSEQDSISLSSNDKFADDWDRHSGVGVVMSPAVSEGTSASFGGADWSALSELDSTNKAVKEAAEVSAQNVSESSNLFIGSKPDKSDPFTSGLASGSTSVSPFDPKPQTFQSGPNSINHSQQGQPSLFDSGFDMKPAQPSLFDSSSDVKPAETSSTLNSGWFNTKDQHTASKGDSGQASLLNANPFTTPASESSSANPWAPGNNVEKPQASFFNSDLFDGKSQGSTPQKSSDPFTTPSDTIQASTSVGWAPTSNFTDSSGLVNQKRGGGDPFQLGNSSGPDQPSLFGNSHTSIFGQQAEQQQLFGQQQQQFGQQQQQPFGQHAGKQQQPEQQQPGTQQQPFGQQQQRFGQQPRQQQQLFGQQQGQQQQPFGQQPVLQQQSFGQQQQQFGQQPGQQQQPFGQQPGQQQQQQFGQQPGQQQQPFGQQPGQQQQPFGKQPGQQQQPFGQQPGQQQQPFGQQPRQQQQPFGQQPGQQQQPFGQQPGQQPLKQQQPFGQRPGQQQQPFGQQPGQQQQPFGQQPGQQQQPFGQQPGQQPLQQPLQQQQPFGQQPGQQQQSFGQQPSFQQFTSPIQGQFSQSPYGGPGGVGSSGNFPGGDFTSPPYLIGQSTPKSPQQQSYSPAPVRQPSAMVSPSAFADLLPLALSPQNSKFKVKQDDTSVKSLTESRSEAKKFEKKSVPTLNDLKVKDSPQLKPPTGDNLLSFD